MLWIIVESALRSLALGAAIWIGLKALRVRTTDTQMVAWTVVLFAALLMPLLMQWRTMNVALPPMVPAISTAHIQPLVHTTARLPRTIPMTPTWSIKWRLVLESGYLAVAVLLLLRMLVGFLLTWRLLRRAVAVREPWTDGAVVRSSEEISVPVTFGSTILMPADWPRWDETKRRAVMIHEQAHVRRGDFFLQAVSALHRVVFWFSPLSWILHRRIAELAEAASDEAAVLAVGDRPSYAEILMQFARKAEGVPAGVAMARLSTVSRRVERILAEAPLPSKTGAAKTTMMVAAIAGVVALVAGFTISAQPSPQPAPRPQAQPMPTPAPTPAPAEPDDNESYAIVSGKSTTVSGSSGDLRRALLLRKKVAGDYIWFERDLKFYYITDPALVARAKELFRPQEELGEKQEALGQQEEKLGAEQERLGEQQEAVTISVPDFTNQMDTLKKQLDILRTEFQKSANKEVSQDSIGDLQDKIGELQSQLGELQSRAGEKMAKLGDLQSKLGEQQAKLGDEQAKLGEEQERLAEVANRELRKLLDAAIQAGLAKPVQELF